MAHFLMECVSLVLTKHYVVYVVIVNLFVSSGFLFLLLTGLVVVGSTRICFYNKMLIVGLGTLSRYCDILRTQNLHNSACFVILQVH